MRKASLIDIKRVDRWYVITEDGMVYSKLRKRWLRPQVNSCGYVHYCLSNVLDDAVWVFAHTLVALKYIGRPPTDKHEIDHLDENKSNNHYSNLVWRTHGENIRESYRRGNRGNWMKRIREVRIGSVHTLETRLKMSNAKKKPVVYTCNGVDTVFESIQDVTDGFGVYRKKVYLCIKNGLPFKDGYLRFLPDEIDEFLL